MSQLGSGAGSDYPGTIDTAEQQTDGASGTLADANWANDVTSAITAIENELGTDPAGTAADLVTRLAKSLADSGALKSGTTANRPASPVMGEPYYNTSLDQLEIYDSDLSSWNSIVGITDHGALSGLTDDDHTQYSLVDGTRNLSGKVALNYASPVVHLAGTEGSADKYAVREDAGVFYISRNTGTIASPSYTDLLSMTTAGVITLSGNIKTPSLSDSNSTNAWDVRGWASDVIADKWGLRPSSLAEVTLGPGLTNSQFYNVETVLTIPYPFWALQLRNTNSMGTTATLRANINIKCSDAADNYSARLKITYTDGTVDYSNTTSSNNTTYFGDGNGPNLDYALTKNDSVESFSVALQVTSTNFAAHTVTVKSDTGTYIEIV